MHPDSQGSKLAKRLLLPALLMALGVVAVAPAAAIAAQPARHYGPFASASEDSGTCGNFWADDTYKRQFAAATTPKEGSYTVVEDFISGRFVTKEGSSPDACDPSGTPGSTILAGVTGNFNGDVILLVKGEYNPDAVCTPTTCNTTKGFVETVYGEAATWEEPSFGFTYHANGPGLVQREWHNASADQGGNGGDIRSS